MLIFWGAGLGAIYYIVTRFIQKTVIWVNEHEAISEFRKNKVLIYRSNLEQLYTKRYKYRSSYRRNGRHITYRGYTVCSQERGDIRKVLVEKIKYIEQARYIEQIIENYWRIKDRKVPRPAPEPVNSKLEGFLRKITGYTAKDADEWRRA